MLAGDEVAFTLGQGRCLVTSLFEAAEDLEEHSHKVDHRRGTCSDDRLRSSSAGHWTRLSSESSHHRPNAAYAHQVVNHKQMIQIIYAYRGIADSR